MLVTIAIEIQWLTHVPIDRATEVYYSGQFNPDSIFSIDFLAMSYMILFLVFSIPASCIIDTIGIRVGLGIGASIVGVAGCGEEGARRKI